MAGRLPEIWAWDAARLEGVHDYIQWLFPLPEPSAFNPHAPILDDGDDRDLPHRPGAATAAAALAELMLDFYGLALESDANGVPRIERARDFAAKSAGWLRPGDHNHLRLTRILTSVRLLGLDDHSHALYRCLAAIARDHPHAVSATTLDYWRRSTAP